MKNSKTQAETNKATASKDSKAKGATEKVTSAKDAQQLKVEKSNPDKDKKK